MKNRFQLGFLLGSLIPLAAICALGHSERVCLAAGAGFLLVPALLWPSRVSRWLEGLGEFYERRTLRPAKAGRRQGSVAGPQDRRGCPTVSESRGERRENTACPLVRSDVEDSHSNPANAIPTPESARRRQDVVSALRNFGCPKPKARAIAEAVAGIEDEQERVFAAMRMVRA